MANEIIDSASETFDVLSQIGRGATVAEFQDAMRNAALTSQRTGKKSEVTLRIVFDPDSKTDAMRLSGKIKMKLPEEPEKAALFFVGPNGNLSRQDPRQIAMFRDQGGASFDPVTGVINEERTSNE